MLILGAVDAVLRRCGLLALVIFCRFWMGRFGMVFNMEVLLICLLVYFLFSSCVFLLLGHIDVYQLVLHTMSCFCSKK